MTVNGSTLATTSSGVVVVQNGATLTGAGTVGTVYLGPGGTLAVGNSNSLGSPVNLTVENLQLFSGCNLNFVLGMSSQSLNGLVYVNNALGLVDGVVLNITDPSGLGTSPDFPLFQLYAMDGLAYTYVNAGWIYTTTTSSTYALSLYADAVWQPSLTATSTWTPSR